jgi:hypothetical protein
MSKCPDIEKKRVGQKAKGQDGKQWIVALRKCRGSDKKCKYWKRVSATFALPKPKKRTKSKPAPKKRTKSQSKTTKSKDVTFNLPAPKAATKKRTKSKASPKKPKTAPKKRGRPKGSKNKKKAAPKKKQVFFKVPYGELIYDNTMEELAYVKDYKVHFGDYKDEKYAYPVDENVYEDSNFDIFEGLFDTEKQWATPNRTAADLIMYFERINGSQLDLLVEMGFDINYHNIHNGYTYNANGRESVTIPSIMHHAVANEDLALVKKLMKMGFNFDAFDKKTYNDAMSGYYLSYNPTVTSKIQRLLFNKFGSIYTTRF